MSIIAFEGFDFYGTSWDDAETNLLSRRELWDSFTTNSFQDTIEYQDRNGGKAIGFENVGFQEGYTYRLNSKYIGTTRLIAGIAFYIEIFSHYSSDYPMMCGVVGGTSHSAGNNTCVFEYQHSSTPGNFKINADLQSTDIRIVDDLAPGIWHYLEFDLKLDAPSHLKTWVNGSMTIDQAISDTGTANYFAISGRPYSYGNGFFLDDLYLLDATDASDGAQFQDRLGPIKIVPSAVSSDGTLGDFDAKSGGDKHVEISESPGEHDKDASYISGSTPGNTQTFNVTGVPTDGDLIAVNSHLVVKKPTADATVTDVGFIQKRGATEEREASGTILQNTYRMVTQPVIALPDAVEMNAANVESTEWGVDLS